MHSKQNTSANDTSVTIRPSVSTFVIFSIMWMIICIPGVAFIIGGDLKGFFPIVLGGILTIGHISTYKISWNDEILTYRKGFRTLVVNLPDVKAFDICGPTAKYGFNPTVALRLFPAASKEPLSLINIKPFGRQDIKRLTDMLERRMQSAP